MKSIWKVQIDSTNYRVEVQYGGMFSYGSGKVIVGNKTVDKWGPSRWGLIPRERTFEIAGKKATLQRTGSLFLGYELMVPGATSVVKV